MSKFIVILTLIVVIIPLHELLHILACKILKVDVIDYSMNMFNPYVKYITESNYKRVFISVIPTIFLYSFGLLLSTIDYMVVVGFLYKTTIICLLPFCKDGNITFKSILLIISDSLSNK